MVVVLGQGDDVAFRSDLEAAAAADLDVGALELPDERAVALEHGHVEAVAVAVPDEDVTSVADVDAIGVVGDVLAADATHEAAVLVEDHHTVTLENDPGTGVLISFFTQQGQNTKG